MLGEIVQTALSIALNAPVKDKIAKQFPNLAENIVENAADVIAEMGSHGIVEGAKEVIAFVGDVFDIGD